MSRRSRSRRWHFFVSLSVAVVVVKVCECCVHLGNEGKVVQGVFTRNGGIASSECASPLALRFASGYSLAFMYCLCFCVVLVLLKFFYGGHRMRLSNTVLGSGFSSVLRFVITVKKVLMVCGLVLGLSVKLPGMVLLRQWFVYLLCALAIGDPFDGERRGFGASGRWALRSAACRISKIAACGRGKLNPLRFVDISFVSLVSCVKRIRIVS